MEVEELKKKFLFDKEEDNEKKLSRSTMDNMLEACIILGYDWRYLYLNDAAVKQCRRPREELQGKVFTEVWPYIENTKVFSLMKDCLGNRTPYSYVNEYEFPDKSIGWFDLRIQPIPEGVFILSVDITTRRKAELKLQESEKRLIHAQYIAKMGDFTLEFETGKVTWSESLCNLLRYKQSDVIDYNRLKSKIIHPDDLERVTKWLNDSVTSGKGTLPTNEYRLICKNKKVIYVRTLGIIQKKDENVTLLFATVLDITKQKLAEIEVKKLNRELEQRVIDRTKQLERMNNELKVFSYSVSHDLKAPLRGIDGYSKLLLEIYSGDLVEEAQLFIRNIRESTIQMNQLIEDLLTYSRLERSVLSMRDIDMQKFIDDMLNLYQNEIKDKNISINIDISNSIITTDQNSLSLALRNIIENAIKFTAKEENAQITIGMSSTKFYDTIFVKDNGIGFNMEYHDKIFDIFQRLHHVEDYPGTGIGLALVAKAMHRLNGRAYAKSEPYNGATFYLEIPKIPVL
jgi:signal transduction histidine kinase